MAPHGASTAASAPRDAPLVQRLEALADDVDSFALPLPTPGAPAAAGVRAALSSQLQDHLLPRLRRMDAPLLAVVGGSTGAGKSTLVNSLLGRVVTTPGVLRPTTRRPTLVHAPADAAWFASREVLPSLPRTTGSPGAETSAGSVPSGGSSAEGGRGVHLVVDAAMPPGFALLDAPDIDSVVSANRDLAAQLLGAADLWIFVTTAARYGDAVPWSVLAGAAERGTALALVLDRVPAEPADVAEEIAADLQRLLDEASLASAPLFTVPESPLSGGLLPPSATAGLREWLGLVGSDAQRRQEVVRSTLTGALASLAPRVETLAAAAQEQEGAVAGLRARLDEVYAGARGQLDEHLTDGSVLRGEVLARWQEFVGTGVFITSVQSAVGRARDSLTRILTNRPAPAQRLDEAVSTGVAALVLDAAAGAREAALLAWRADPAGAAVLAAAPPAAREDVLPTGVRESVERLVRDWQGFVLVLVSENGQGRRTQARMLSLGISGVGAALMVAVFAGTAGLTGAEVGIAGGTALLSQRVLEAVFGEDAVRRLATRARDDLSARVKTLMEAQQESLAVHLPALDEGLVARLRAPLDVAVDAPPAVAPAAEPTAGPAAEGGAA